jgi:ectoine hydroxylase-related dioxygenase (phytanoyl-CoA dioxygenase family)
MKVRNITQAAMNMSRPPAAADVSAAWPAINALGLEKHVAEMEALGYTVIPPEISGTAGLAADLLARITELSTEERGVRPDFETGSSHADSVDPIERQTFLLAKGEVFEKALMNPVVQAMVQYLLGDEAVLSSCLGRLKGPGGLPLLLHTDQSFHPAPLPLVCNVNYLLTDYDRENGALCFVPGSHQLQRHPLPGENFDLGGLDRAGAERELARGCAVDVREPAGLDIIEAPAGSLVVWPGNTWHGALPRTAPGLRGNLILYFCSKWLRPQEAYRECLPQEILERNDDAFTRLIGSEIFYGWGPEGTDFDANKAFFTARRRAGTI